MRLVTPFNIFLLFIALLAVYVLYTTYERRQVVTSVTQAAPGHTVLPEGEEASQTDLTVTVFYDYSCPFCVMVDPTIRDAKNADGRVRLIYKFMSFINDRSERLARLAYAAGKQDAFLEAHDYMLDRADQPFEEAQIRQMAENLQLDYEQLIRDSESRAAQNVIRENEELAYSLGINSTPTFLIGNRFFVPEGRMPNVQDFRRMFSEERNKM
jgi:protein-disulfide isomerase